MLSLRAHRGMPLTRLNVSSSCAIRTRCGGLFPPLACRASWLGRGPKLGLGVTAVGLRAGLGRERLGLRAGLGRERLGLRARLGRERLGLRAGLGRERLGIGTVGRVCNCLAGSAYDFWP